MKICWAMFAVIYAPLCASAGGPDLDKSPFDDLFSGKAAISLPDAREMPPAPEAKWVNGIFQAQIEEMQLNKHGAKLSDPQSADVEDAIARLMNTEYGYELCRAVSHGCSLESFKRYGIEIRVRPMENALGETPAYAVGTKKVITLAQDLLDPKKFKYGDIAAVLAHELSHVQDVAKYHSPLLDARLATEKKAYTATLAVYTELYDSDRECISTNSDLYTIMQVWRYKFEGGPPPDALHIGGELFSGKLFADTFFSGDAMTRQGFIHAMTTYYYPNVPAANQGAANWTISMDLHDIMDKRLSEYAQWRIEHKMNLDSYYTPPVVPVQPVTPPVHPVVPPPPVNPPVPPVTPPVHPVNPPVPPVTPPVHPVNPPVPPVTPPVHPVNPPVHPPPPPDDGNDDDGGNDGGYVDIGPDNPLYPH